MIRRLFGTFTLLALVLLASASIAKADGIDTFKYQSDGNTFTWTLPVSPVVLPGDAFPGFGFDLENVAISENGGPPQLGTLGFFSTLCAGGFDMTIGSNFLVTTGWEQLYHGPESAPTFNPGPYSLTDYAVNSNGLPGTLVVSTPEPSAIGLLSLGLLVLMIAVAWKKKRETASALA